MREVAVSDVGLAIVALDQEYYRNQECANEARREQAQASLREKYHLDRMKECERAIKKLTEVASYTVPLS